MLDAMTTNPTISAATRAHGRAANHHNGQAYNAEPAPAGAYDAQLSWWHEGVKKALVEFGSAPADRILDRIAVLETMRSTNTPDLPHELAPWATRGELDACRALAEGTITETGVPAPNGETITAKLRALNES